jgi:hypothetical protein
MNPAVGKVINKYKNSLLRAQKDCRDKYISFSSE